MGTPPSGHLSVKRRESEFKSCYSAKLAAA